MNNIIMQNQSSWNTIADDWFGTTALPEYGCLMPKETELNLFGDVAGKKLLDIGCGSGHSLLYHGKNGAGELWGLDLSIKQIENAGRLLKDNGFSHKLFCSPMEENPGLPLEYFDIAYSIYALGWTIDLKTTLRLVSSYLKPGGIFIFSWDHPFMHCVSPRDGYYELDGGYFDESLFNFKKNDAPMSIYNRKISTYINELYNSGFITERLVEETDRDTMSREPEFSSRYYAAAKAKLIPLSFVIKARKL